MSSILVVLYGVCGIGVALAMLRRPDFFWALLPVVIVGSAGLMVYGHAIVDEYIVGLLVAAVIVLLLGRKVQLVQPEQSRLAKAHEIVFLLLAAYLLVQAIRGMIVLEDIRMLRWVAFFGLLGVLGFLLPRLSLAKPSPERISVLLVFTSVVYFALYILYGVFAETIRGISRWQLQGLEWTGTTAAFFPALFALPALFLLWEKKTELKQRIALLAAYAVVVFASFFYDSRAAWYVILSFVFVAGAFGLVTRKKSIIACSAAFLLVFFLFLQVGPWVSSSIAEPAEFVRERTKDLIFSGDSALRHQDRVLHTQVAWRGLTSDTSIFFWGEGWYVHRITFGMYLLPLAEEKGIATNKKPGDLVRTSAFSAVAIDTGVVGIGLFLLAGVVTALRLFQKSTTYTLYASMLFLVVLGMMFLWPFVGNITPLVLFYFALMPGGILFLMRPHKV